MKSTEELDSDDLQEHDDESHSEQRIVLPIGAEESSLGYIELSQGPDFSREALSTARGALILAGVGTTLVAFLVGLFMSKRLTRPLVQLTATVQNISEKNLSIRAPEYGKDEIGRLARQFNRMAERLETPPAPGRSSLRTARMYCGGWSGLLRICWTCLDWMQGLLISTGSPVHLHS